MEYTLIEFDKINKNNRIYSRASLSNIPERVPCLLEHTNNKDLLIPQWEDGCGVANIIVTPTEVKAQINPFLNDKKGEMFNTLIEEGYVPVISGTGNVDASGNIDDFNLHYVFLTNDPA